MKPATDTALPIAHMLLRILVLGNWLMVAVIVVLLFASRPWIMSAFDLSPSIEADRLIFALRAIAVLGLGGVPLNYIVLKRLLAIVETVRARGPLLATSTSPVQTGARCL